MASPALQAKKEVRILACTQCQARKIRCDRKFPCANCLRSGHECISPNALPSRPRRRRFAERELLDRIKDYETLLQDNNIEFRPLHPDHIGKGTTSRSSTPGEALTRDQPSKDEPSPSMAENSSDTLKEPVNIWNAMNQKSPFEKHFHELRNDDEDEEDEELQTPFLIRQNVVRTSLDELYHNHDSLMLQSRKTDISLSMMHPGQAQILQLWQLYVDNVDPILKVTHNPTLQQRIIEAASDVASVSPGLEALMFSIYCMAVLSTEEKRCQQLFKTQRGDLLVNFQLAAQQALVSSGALRSGDAESLTALYLYMISCTQNTDPRSITISFGLITRIAQRMGLSNESTYAKHSVMEAEMRRRLWWSIVALDNRLCEMSDTKSSSLTPTWNCKTPNNLNDTDLRLEMRKLPVAHDRPTEAIFVIVRSEISNYVRYCDFHLDFFSPVLKFVVKHIQPGFAADTARLTALEKLVEEKYLKFCDEDNPIHFMTIWTSRAVLAKYRLMEHYLRIYSAAKNAAPRHDAAMDHAINMLECDTKLITSPLTRGFYWFIHFQFPFPAYTQLVHDLKRTPVGEGMERGWQALSASYEARFLTLHQDSGMFFKLFHTAILQSWDAREAELLKLGGQVDVPQIIWLLREKKAQKSRGSQKATPESSDFSANLNLDDFFMPMQMDFGSAFNFDLSPQDLGGFANSTNGNLDLGAASADWSGMTNGF